jgi:N-methylhydantoinase A
MHFFFSCEEFLSSPVYDYARLSVGAVVEGPAIIEQENSTIVVPPRYFGKLDAYHNLIIGDQECPR